MTHSPLYPDLVLAPDALVDVLIAAGIRYVFGLSGGHTGRIFAALEKRQDAIRTLLVREESLGSAMAETIGRMTGVPGVILGQGPWVLGNGLLGTIEARLSSSPMLLLTDFSDTPPHDMHAPYQSGTGDYGGWDARAAFGAVTKQVFHADTPNEGVIATRLAVKHALAGQPGPVAVIYSILALDGMAGGAAQPVLYPAAPYIRPAEPGLPDLGPATATMAGAARPLILAGNGVRIGGAETALAALAARCTIPVVTTPSGKGVFDETSPLSAGTIGSYGNPLANHALRAADVVLVAGSKLSASDTLTGAHPLIDPARQTLIQIDTEPRNLGWTQPVTHALQGGAAPVLRALAQAMNPASPGASWLAGVNVPRTLPLPHESGGVLTPPGIIAAMQAHLPPETIYTCDAGENRIFMLHYLRTLAPGRFSQPAGAGPMGYAVPSAMAQRLLNPELLVVAFGGDGGFSMTMNGLLTAVEESLPILCVVMNNSALGWSQHSRGPFATQFARVDYAAIARGMGCVGVAVRAPRDLPGALRAATLAVRQGQPAVIDVETTMDISFAELADARTRTVFAAG
ncbi:thiamine pyrophosphate-binding protein [Gemmobacter sp.]|uniref:thiamine pyrophosphate-binding protein n=1 Tax=Gemmobacter sp. TaxID=1898957 RepID=UPI002AFFA5FA|nr:thiamine pyrophosphate-binding protein [Gemmobacter sp.]